MVKIVKILINPNYFIIHLQYQQIPKELIVEHQKQVKDLGNYKQFKVVLKHHS
jgi:hypothetical protein